MAAQKTFGPQVAAMLAALKRQGIFTLRDARRLAANPTRHNWEFKPRGETFHPAWVVCLAAQEVAGLPNEGWWPNVVDRLISKLGPRWPLSMMDEWRAKDDGSPPEPETSAQAEDVEEPEIAVQRELGEDRAKDTDEVAEASDSPSEEAELHGGDGNSGEVDAPAETRSEDDRSGASPEEGDSSDEGEDRPTFEYDEDASEAKNFERFLDFVKEMEAHEAQLSSEEAQAEKVEQKLDVTPLSAKGSHGGVNASMEMLERCGDRADPRAIGEIVRQIEKIFRTFTDNAGQEISPRLSGKRLVRELVSKRVNLARARREELQPGTKVLMCDVSGSCSAVCRETLAACAAVAKADPQVVVVVHSNGYPEQVVGQAAAGIAVSKKYGDATGKAAFWTRLMEQCRVIGTINWGDWDAGEELKLLAERAPLVWLDSYCARDGVKSASKKLRSGASSWKTQPVAWWQGVNDAATTVIALRQAAKK